MDWPKLSIVQQILNPTEPEICIENLKELHLVQYNDFGWEDYVPTEMYEFKSAWLKMVQKMTWLKNSNKIESFSWGDELAFSSEQKRFFLYKRLVILIELIFNWNSFPHLEYSEKVIVLCGNYVCVTLLFILSHLTKQHSLILCNTQNGHMFISFNRISLIFHLMPVKCFRCFGYINLRNPSMSM